MHTIEIPKGTLIRPTINRSEPKNIARNEFSGPRLVKVKSDFNSATSSRRDGMRRRNNRIAAIAGKRKVLKYESFTILKFCSEILEHIEHGN